jgi:mono/diheme cytochrome c family protein
VTDLSNIAILKPNDMKTRIVQIISIIFISVFICASCSEQNMPPKSDIESILVQSLPFHRASLDRSEILATENIGDNVEPIIKMRIKSTWVFDEELFEKKYEKHVKEYVYIALDIQGVKAETYDIVVAKQKGADWIYSKLRESTNVLDPKLKGFIESHFSEDKDSYSEWRTRYWNQVLSREELPQSSTILTQEEYNEREKKYAAQMDKDFNKLTLFEVLALGLKTYNAVCVACHQANGKGIPGKYPGLSESKVVMGKIEDLVNLILHGKSGTEMHAFGEQLNVYDIAAVTTYVRNTWRFPSLSGILCL